MVYGTIERGFDSRLVNHRLTSLSHYVYYSRPFCGVCQTAAGLTHPIIFIPEDFLTIQNTIESTTKSFITSGYILCPSKRLDVISEISSFGRAIPYQGICNGFNPHTSGQKPIYIYHSYRAPFYAMGD